MTLVGEGMEAALKSKKAVTGLYLKYSDVNLKLHELHFKIN